MNVRKNLKRAGVVLILLFAFFGIADSAYLAKQSLSGEPLICDVVGFSDCNTVAASPYSKMFGIPLGIYGVAFYTGMFILAAVELLLSRVYLRRLLQVGALIGLVASVWFSVVQFFFIGAFCIYCLVSAGLTLLMALTSWFLEPIGRRVIITPPPKMPPLLMPPL